MPWTRLGGTSRVNRGNRLPGCGAALSAASRCPAVWLIRMSWGGLEQLLQRRWEGAKSSGKFQLGWRKNPAVAECKFRRIVSARIAGATLVDLGQIVDVPGRWYDAGVAHQGDGHGAVVGGLRYQGGEPYSEQNDAMDKQGEDQSRNQPVAGDPAVVEREG